MLHYQNLTIYLITNSKNNIQNKSLTINIFTVLLMLPMQFSHSILQSKYCMDLSEQTLKFIFQRHKMEYIKKLGSGGFGTVYLVNSIGQEFLPLAVKCITKKQLIKRPSLEKYLTQEINSMQSLKHANIVKLIQTFVEESSIFLVMEYCEYGNLYSYQYGLPEKVFKFDEACRIFLQILNGLQAIHHENIIHRDIKCENILLKKIPKQNTYICKIGDFGFAKQLSQTAKSHCGTPNFMAPEILAEKDYDKCVDIWSIGVILFYMLFGDYPFKGMNLLYDIESKCNDGYDLLRENNPQLIRKKNKSINQKQFMMLSDFFKSIFIINTAARITIADIYKHPLFKNYQTLIQSTSGNIENAEMLEEQRISTLKKIQFVQSVQVLIKNDKILSPQNQIVLKFMLMKVSLWIMSGYLKQSELYLDKQNKANFCKKIDKLLEEYKRLKVEIQKMIAIKQSLGINILLPQLNTPYDKFQQFKDIYRTFLGYVFSQIHNSVLKEKQKIKIRVLCCHTINRVFEDPKSKYFQIYSSWTKAKIKQKRFKYCFEFDLFSKWIEEDTSDNVSKTISAINDYFYSKK